MSIYLYFLSTIWIVEYSILAENSDNFLCIYSMHNDIYGKNYIWFCTLLVITDVQQIDLNLKINMSIIDIESINAAEACPSPLLITALRCTASKTRDVTCIIWITCVFLFRWKTAEIEGTGPRLHPKQVPLFASYNYTQWSKCY